MRMAMITWVALLSIGGVVVPGLGEPASLSSLESDPLTNDVNAALARAARIGQATAGSDTPSQGSGSGSGKGICLLEVCTQGAPEVAPGGGSVSYNVALGMLVDFVRFGLCLDAQHATADLVREADPDKRTELRAKLSALQTKITPYIQKEYCDKMNQ